MSPPSLPVTVTLGIQGPVEQAVLYWGGFMNDDTVVRGDRELLFDGNAITGAVAGNEVIVDAADNAVGYVADVTSIVQAAFAGPGSYSFEVGDADATDNLDRFHGVSLLVIYEDPSEVADYRVIVFDGLDYAFDFFTGANGETDPVTFSYDAFGDIRTAEFTYLGGGGEADRSERLAISDNPDILDNVDSGDGDQWDTDTFFGITIPANSTSTTVQYFSEPGQFPSDSLLWVVAALRLPVPVCGDGVVDPGEECDDGNDINGDGCDNDCTISPFCGDGNLDPGEECDDGNNLDGDGCSADCTVEFEDLGCRYTGGLNSTFQTGNGENRYTAGGQAGANTALPPQPAGEWTHTQHSGPAGSFTFHGGTASAPEGTEVDEIRCADPGGCAPSGNPPSPLKQLDFDGIGTFKNIGKNDREPDFVASGATVTAEGNGNKDFDGTFHWFEVNIDDLGEPGNTNPKKNPDDPDASLCPPTGFGEKGAQELANCGCSDFYRITIYDGVPAADVVKNADGSIDRSELNTTDVIYEVCGYIEGGNLQIHRLTGFDLK